MNGYKVANRFVSRIVIGSVLAIFLGIKLDEGLHTAPLFLTGLLMYVMIGSLVLLVKEMTNGRKN